MTKKVYNNILETIGNTPLVKLNSVVDDLPCTVYAKVEFFNPGGSVKDRIGPAIIAEAEQSGRLKPGGTIVESTSGNTGVGLAITAAIKGYNTIFVMPDKMSQEKIELLRAFGAEVVVTPTAVEPEDPRSYYQVAARLVRETPNAILANQYHNPMNPQAHYDVTGPEIWAQIGDEMTHFVAGLGTGGTISGTGKYLKEQNPNIQIVGVDPLGSILYDLHRGVPIEETTAEGYKVEGIGEDFLPSTTDLSVVDAVVQVNDRESFIMTRRLVREEGIFCGGSCGAAVVGALKYARQANLGPDDTLVVILPDSGSRYLSKIFNDNWMRENGYLQRTRPNFRAVDIHAQKEVAEIVTVTAETTMEAAIGLMKSHNISQLPVVDHHNHLQGLVTEIDLLNHLLLDEHQHAKGEPIASLVNYEPVTVTPNTAVADLMRVFRDHSVAMITDEGNHVLGILTKIDMLDFLASSAAE
ncbi:MAG: cystathionine beta-synthase [Anaerolineales bacterium]|nr:cystathionine beta-synthase [Anaerolineales bacterium]